MNILITGGFGFIGTNLIKKLLAQKHNITVIDDLSSGTEIANKDILFYNLSVDSPRCEKIFDDSNFDIVIHLAFKGYSGLEFRMNNEDSYTNNMGLNNILYLSHKYKVKKVIILSSFRVYGQRNSKSLNETSHLAPNSLEGESYLIRESLANEYRRLGLNIVVLRVGALYGPYQYGTDLSYINNNKEKIGDILHINDLCDAVARLIENYTDHLYNISQKGGFHIMDSSKIRESLSWYPKYDFSTDYLSYTEDIEELKEAMDKRKNILNNILGKIKIVFKYNEVEITLVFLIIFYLNYISKFKLGLNIDLSILYIVLISLFYGIKQGITAVLLSILSYLFFYFNYEGKTVISLINDIGSILNLTMYFILGTSIGYIVDEQRKGKTYLVEEMDQINEEIDFIRELYNKSLEVRNNLQVTIENYENNLSKVNRIVGRLKSLSMESIYREIPKVYSEGFNVRSVSLYILEHEKLKLISYKGDMKYSKTININDFDFLPSLLKNEYMFINRDFNKEYPSICIKIANDDFLLGIVFLDNIEFKYLSQYYLNDLRVTSNIIASLSYKTYKYEKVVGGI